MKNKKRILNLYAGIGGNRKLWGAEYDIVAVENNEEIANIYQSYFPEDTVIVADAHKYLLKYIQEFDFVWSSPPCPTHSTLRLSGVCSGQNNIEYPDMRLYQEIILLKYFAKKGAKWAVENVTPYYKSLIKPSVILGRHYIWTNFYVRNYHFVEEGPDINHTFGNENKYGFDISGLKLNHRKDQILRNLVNPKIGLYLLEQSEKDLKPLFNFNY